MSAMPVKAIAAADPDLGPMRKRALEALVEIFNRAVQHGPGAPEIEDAKADVKDNRLNPSGPLQDCEFGMALLLVCEWLGEEVSASIDRSATETLVCTLVVRIVNRTLLRNQSDKGGGGSDHVAFFTGEPYTEYQRGRNYSANLDAAMITVAFLAAAVAQYNEQLAKVEHGIQERDAKLPDWAKSLRDAALFVILEGLKYAQECRVMNNGQFRGFTSDPESNAARPESGYLDRDEDRLFFTWTACETINDMALWRDKYFNGRLPSPPPAQAVAHLNPLIDDLRETLRKAAEWCKDAFLERFETFEPRETKEVVRDVGQLRVGAELSVDQQDRVARMATTVQYVYHLSQYAAIRSLVPESVSLNEVRTIIDKLDLLVSRYIIASLLDEAEHPVLYRALTREYSLGKSNTEPYRDDAWYPLVVRSLSGLLSRTLTDIGTRFSRKEVLELTLLFQRALENHVKNMLDRTPSGGEAGPDGKLWSFAADQPYVLYATQRTIFALMKYEEFVISVRGFANEENNPTKWEEELSILLARRLAEYFRPVIKESLAQVAAPPNSGSGSQSRNLLDLSSFEEPWAVRVIGQWLAKFNEDFKYSQVAPNLSQRANMLRRIKRYAEAYQPSDQVTGRKRDNAQLQLETLKAEYERICNCADVGDKLTGLVHWEEEELRFILFEYLFLHYVQQPAGSIEKLLVDDSMELWKLIKEASGTQENISKLDPTAKVL